MLSWPSLCNTPLQFVLNRVAFCNKKAITIGNNCPPHFVINFSSFFKITWLTVTSFHKRVWHITIKDDDVIKSVFNENCLDRRFFKTVKFIRHRHLWFACNSKYVMHVYH